MENMNPGGSSLVKFLGDIISEEVAKPEDQIDMELIDECDSFLSDLLDDGLNLTDNEINKRYATVMSRIKKEQKRRRISISHIARKFAVFAAAVLVVVVSTLSVYAYFPSFHDWVNRILNLPVGSSFEAEEITFINNGEPIVYSDMETLIKNEGLEGILYPKNLPKDLKILSVKYNGKETEYPCIDFEFSDSSIFYSIELNNRYNNEEPVDGDYVETTGNLTFVIKKIDCTSNNNLSGMILYHASATDGEGRYYVIEAPTIEKVRELIHKF